MREGVMTSLAGPIIFGIACAMGLLHAYLVARMWHDPERAEVLVGAAIARTPEKGRAIARSHASLGLVWWAFLLPYPFVWYECGIDMCSNDFDALLDQHVVLGFSYIGLLLAAGTLFFVSMYFSRPRLLIPPHMRNDPTYWSIQRASRVSTERAKRVRRRREQSGGSG